MEWIQVVLMFGDKMIQTEFIGHSCLSEAVYYYSCGYQVAIFPDGLGAPAWFLFR